ncbi:MAG: hypothetical protein K5787_17840 [Lentisphaeria bacterium]|nr:hypothetical protein [Lentisphaeria bacterium]
MKKITWLLAFTMMFGMLRAQTSKEIFDAALVPKAPLVLYVDGHGVEDNPMTKALKPYITDFQETMAKNAVAAGGDQKKVNEVYETLKANLGLKDDDGVKWQFSVSIGNMQFDAGEPDLSLIDMVFVVELKKALTPEKVKTALLDADKKCGNGDAMDKADFNITERNGAKIFAIDLKETDDTVDFPKEFRNLRCAFLADGKILLFGTEKSVFAALDRIASKTPAEKNPYIKRLFDDNETAFLALGMLPQLKEFLGTQAAKGQEGDPQKTAAKAFVNADGISFTVKQFDDKATVALNLDLGQPEDAALLKGQLWDGMIAPMLPQFKPGIVGALGGEFALLDTLKCTCEAKRMAIAFDVKEADVKTLLNFIKKKNAPQDPAQAPAEE